MFPRTIRGRLLSWIAGLFGLALAGFGVTAFHLYKISAQQQIDDELERRVNRLQVDWRASVPPGGGNGSRGGKAGKGGKRPHGGEEGGGPPDGRRGETPTWRLSSETLSLFPGEPRGYYYAGWTNRGRLLARSSNGPADIPRPDDEGTGLSYYRTRGAFREMYHITGQGDSVLVGVSTENAIAARRYFASWLVAAGGVVLAVGLGGSWVLIRRSFRPVEEISAAAKRIADGALAERVKVEDARNELGGLAAVLNSTFARLEAAISDEKSFTSDASHELRTPLTVMLSEIQLVLAQERTKGEYRESLEVCHETLQEMVKLTDSLLELARLDAGKERVRRAPLDLQEIMTSAVRLVEPLALRKQIQITVAGGAAPAQGDAERIRQVGVNLLQNAIQYNHEGGTIRVITAVDDTHAIVAVSDTGVGIGPEDLPNIFKRFYRADKARSRSEGNCGLGLAICKSIIDAHTGTIAVESTPGAGTTFTVRIPRA